MTKNPYKLTEEPAYTLNECLAKEAQSHRHYAWAEGELAGSHSKDELINKLVEACEAAELVLREATTENAVNAAIDLQDAIAAAKGGD